MELTLFLLKGILIGLLFGVPVGSVGTMTIQRTLEHGIKAGLITGLGSSAADCIYASIGAFGLTLVSDFLLKYMVAVIVVCSRPFQGKGCSPPDRIKPYFRLPAVRFRDGHMD